MPAWNCHNGRCAPPVCPQPPGFLSPCRHFCVNVAMRASSLAIALISIILYFSTYVLSQACVATSQNPYCDPSFANLICCPSPNVCYWADRQGTPACCAQGQVCGVGGGVYITPQPETITATDGTEPTATATLVGGVVGTVTSGAVGIFSTVVRFTKLWQYRGSVTNTLL
jgi:hypothetical protein